MAIQMIPMYCPNCGAQFDADMEREFMFCQYCGTKIMIHNTNTYTLNYNETKRTIDETRIAESINQTEVEKLKQIKEIKNNRNALIAFGFIFAMVIAILFFG